MIVADKLRFVFACNAYEKAQFIRVYCMLDTELYFLYLNLIWVSASDLSTSPTGFRRPERLTALVSICAHLPAAPFPCPIPSSVFGEGSPRHNCYINLTTLKDGITRVKRGGRGAVVAVDITKAFDTVPHSVFLSTLKERGIRPHSPPGTAASPKCLYTVAH